MQVNRRKAFGVLNVLLLALPIFLIPAGLVYAEDIRKVTEERTFSSPDPSCLIDQEKAPGERLPGPPNMPLTTFERTAVLSQDNSIISGGENFPNKQIIQASMYSGGEFYHNGRHTSSARLTAGDELLFRNVGHLPSGKNFHAAMTIISASNVSVGIWSQGIEAFRSSTLGSGIVKFILDYIDEDGIPIDDDIAVVQGYHFGTNSFLFSKDALQTVFGTSNDIESSLWSLEDNMLRIGGRTNNTRLNFIATRGENGFITEGTSSFTVPFRNNGTTIDNDYSQITVDGLKIEDRLFSSFIISQRVPEFAFRDLEIVIENPVILKGKESRVLSIKDSKGNDLTSIIDIYHGEEQGIFNIPQEEMAKFRGETIEIEIEYPIDKSKNPKDFLVGDYLEIDLEVSNSQSSTVATGTAKTWARPWGDPVPQEVGQGLSTADLDPEEFVENLANKLEGDEPFVVGFSEEKTFDTLGDTTVDVIIESQISGIQNTISVPVKVIEADVVLTVEFVNEINQLLPEYTVILDGKIWDVVDLTTEPTVLEQIQALDQAGYEIVTRPENESSFALTQTEMTARYQVTGLLRLTSAPNALDFGSLTYNARTQRVEKPTFDQEKEPLLVTDTRASADSGWTMMATLSSPLVNEDDKELVNALRYVFEGEETILDTNALIIHRQNDAQRLFNVSDTWGDTQGSDGLKLQIGSRDVVHAGNYQGTITWTIMAGQP